jgi:hypothetical protein
MKAKFNVEFITSGNVIYPESFVELVKRYEDTVIEVEEILFDGGYEVELEGRTFALGNDELYIL